MIIFVSGTYIISQEQMYKFVVSDKVYIACDTSSAPVTLYMPKITQEFMNVQFYISDGSSNAASNNITILPNGTDLINGGASIDITSNDGCCVLTTASTSDVNNDILSPQSIWIASSSQSGGGGGSYTANNGLNLAGTTFKLGGTLSQNTSINNNGFDLDIYSNTPTTSGVLLDVYLNATGNAIQSIASNGFGLRTKSFSGINIEGYSFDDYTAQLLRNDASASGIVGMIRLDRGTTATPFGGIGGSIDFWIEPRLTGFPTPPLPTEPTVRLAGLWENPGPNVASRLSRLDFYGYSGGAGNLLNASLRGDGFFSLYQYGLGTFVDTPAYSLGVDASGNVVEFVASGGGNANITYILEANLLALELANNLDLNTIYIVTDTPNFMLMCKAETTGIISNTATIVDAGNGSYSGIVNYVSRDSSLTTRIGSVIINDDTSGSPSNNNQFIGVMPSSWTLGNSSRRNVFHTLSSGALGSACQVNTFHQASFNNVLGDSCESNTFYQVAGDNTLGDSCTSNIFEQQAQQNILGNACLYNKFELGSQSNTLLDSCEANIFGANSNSNILGVSVGGCIGNIFYYSASNQLGDGCEYNTFQQQAGFNQLGNNCTHNMFEQRANSNFLQDSCQNNKFEQSANLNQLGQNCSSNIFGINSSTNSIGNNANGNTFSQDTNTNVLGVDCQFNTFEQGANNNTLDDDAVGNTFKQGVNGFVFGSGLKNVTVIGTALGLDLTNPVYSFIYNQTTPATISWDSANSQWYHLYFDSSSGGSWITTIL